MKQTLNLLILLILASCTTTGVTETPVVAVSTGIIPTNPYEPSPISSSKPSSSPSPTATIIPTVKPTITFTPVPACDPFSADFCISAGHFIFQRPIQPPGNDRIDLFYGYGSTADGTREPHHGVEFENASGTPVHAVGNGTVIFAAPDDEAIYAPWPDFYGNLVVIEHQDQVFTLYAHLSRIDVQAGQDVLAGNKIGEVGRTGGAIGSHLHFEVRRGDVEDYFSAQNPQLWLVPAKDETGTPSGALMISVMDGAGDLLEKGNFTIGYYEGPSQSPIRVYYATPYASELLHGEENLALGELSAGQYRIVVETNGHISERWVEVESGRLTQVVFIVK